jgi:hypothetical protein
MGIAINFATGMEANWLAWAGVAVSMILAGVVTAGVQLKSKSSPVGHALSEGGRQRVSVDVSGNRSSVNTIAGDGSIIHGGVHHSAVNGWLVSLVLGVAAIAAASTLVPLTILSGKAGDAAPRQASADNAGTELPALAASAAWPFTTGCAGLGQVAMPAGQGKIEDFHAVTDVRSTLAESGAGSWTRGMLYIDLSTVNGRSVHVQNILPKRLRRDLAAPAWIYAPDDGCGPSPESRLFTYNLDVGEFKDQGTPNSDLANPDPGIPTAQLGPGFVISGAEHALIEVSAASCHGNYEWNLDIQYVETGGDEVKHLTKGPFESYGVANNTKVYRGHQDQTGSIQVDDVSTINGSDSQLDCDQG